MVSIVAYQSAAGRRWRVRYRKPDGRQTDKRGFERRKDAELWAAEHVTSAKAHGAYVDPQDSRRTITQLYEAWIAAKKVRLKPSYLDDLEGAWSKYVAPVFGASAVGRVTRAQVQEWVSAISSGKYDGRAKSATVVLRAHGVLAGVLDDAVADRLVPVNVARGVVLPRKTRSAHTYLTARQLFALADACGPYRSFVLTLGLTGLRWGEATALLVGDVDLVRRRIQVSKSATEVRHRIVMGTPKTHEMRSVTFPAMLGGVLPLDGRSPDEILFFDPDGIDGHVRQIDSPRTYDGSWFAKATIAAGLPRMTVHDLRHTAASLMVSSGASIMAVKNQLGHRNASMTLDVYSDLFDDDLDLVGTAMDRLLERSVGKLWAN